MSFDQPSGVVAFAEREQRLAQILDRVEGLHPQEIFLQGSDEAFGTAIALGVMVAVRVRWDCNCSLRGLVMLVPAPINAACPNTIPQGRLPNCYSTNRP
jgi:hypothetical protein